MLTACPKKYISQFTDGRKATERYSHVKNQPCCFVCFSVGLAIYFYSWKKQRAISLLCLRTLRQNNLAETSSSSQRLQQTLNKSIIPIRIKWQTHLSPGISTISTIFHGMALLDGWMDGWHSWILTFFHLSFKTSLQNLDCRQQQTSHQTARRIQLYRIISSQIVLLFFEAIHILVEAERTHWLKYLLEF